MEGYAVSKGLNGLPRHVQLPAAEGGHKNAFLMLALAAGFGLCGASQKWVTQVTPYPHRIKALGGPERRIRCYNPAFFSKPWERAVTEPLRPMSTGELLDRTFALYRKNFALFVGIAAVTHAIYFAYQLLTIHSVPVGRVRFGPAYYTNLALAWVFMTVVLTVSQAATVKAVAAVHLDQPASVWGSYGGLRGRIVSVFGVLFFVLLIVGLITGVLLFFAVLLLGVLIVALGPSGAARSGPANIVIGFIFIAAFFAIFVAVYVRYALAVQACVVEDLRAWAAMKRSAALSKGGRLRIAAVYVVLVIFSWIVATAMAWLTRMAATPLHSWTASMILIDLAGFVAGSLTGPLTTIGLSLLYYDERVRKEAFDLTVMLARLEPPAPSAAPLEV
jgi:hypothetical protein